jgi:hypothetical protein
LYSSEFDQLNKILSVVEVTAQEYDEYDILRSYVERTPIQKIPFAQYFSKIKSKDGLLNTSFLSNQKYTFDCYKDIIILNISSARFTQ